MYLSELFLAIVKVHTTQETALFALVACVEETTRREIGINEFRDLYDVCREFA